MSFPYACIYNQRKKKKDMLNGDAGHRSRCLSHAKRALYQVSYIPVLPNQTISQYLISIDRENMQNIIIIINEHSRNHNLSDNRHTYG